MKIIQNPMRGIGMPAQIGLAEGEITADAGLVTSLLQHCPVHAPTPLVNCFELAAELGIASLHVKDERQRMRLGSFKALGAAFSIAKAAHKKIGDEIADPAVAKTALHGTVFVTSSAGNHGLSVAAGANIFGAQAIIYLSVHVPNNFADRLRAMGAQVEIVGNDYEASMTAAIDAANANGWTLLSDSTWVEDTTGRDIMEGYLALCEEMITQYGDAPTHMFLQAGVGGLASAAAVAARKAWGDMPNITVVEPMAAPALQASIEQKAPALTVGPPSNMGRLDCKEPSHLALKALARDADAFLTLSDEYVATEIARLEAYSLETSPSGGAGFAATVAMANELGTDARVLLVLSEGPADG
jgi:diaminopropionate ammonia-lyase